MRIASGVTDQYIYFVAVDATDLKTRKTGLSGFTVYRSRNGGAAAAYTTPTINETDSANMPGVYELLLDEDMTIDSGDETQEVVLHITVATMAPVTRVFELYRPKITAGNTLNVEADGDIGGNVTGSVGSVAGAVGSVTGAVTVGTINANVITATSIQDAAFTAAKFASGAFDAVWSVATRVLTAGTNIGFPTAQNIWEYATRTLTSLAGLLVNANLTQIDGQATNGNNATLNLKKLNIVNNAGDALVAQSTGGNGVGIKAEGQGSGSGVDISSPGATGLLIQGDTGLTISGSTGEGVNINGGTEGLNISGGNRALVLAGTNGGVVVTTTNNEGIVVGHGTGAEAVYAPDFGGVVVDDAGNSASSFMTSLTEAVDDFWKGAFCKMSYGALRGQVRKITGYNGTTKVLTCDAFTSEPAADDEFIIVNE